MRLRWVSSSMNSERSRIRVIGVRRSWLIAASILVRSSIRPVMRSRIRFSAFATERISSGPRSGSGGGGAVQAETFGGFGKRRQRRGQRARRPQPEQGDADDGKQQRHHPGAAQNGGRGRCSGSTLAEIIAPSGSAMPILRVSPSGGSAKMR